MKKAVILFLFTITTYLGYSQHVALNDSSASFGNQVAMFLDRSGNSEAASIGQDFNALWPNSFSQEQQGKIIEIALRLQEKKYPQIPYQRDFFGALISGINLAAVSGRKLDNFLDMLSQSLERSTSRNFARELVNLRIFFEKQMLHTSRYNSLYVSEADFDFDFIAVRHTVLMKIS